MTVLTLKITNKLDTALQAASLARALSKSALARQALEQSLANHAQHTPAERCVAQWRGRLATPQAPRLSHLLAKHF